MRKKVALFGGSFNPIHIGHLALANYICEEQWVDELWFLLTPENPLKQHKNQLDEHVRLEMVQAAIKGYHKFKASDFEFHLPRPSYTINTLKALNENYPEYEFHLVIGADNWVAFDQWKSHKEILANFHILIYPRNGYTIDSDSLPPNVQFIETPQIEVSSTFIRESLKKRMDIRYFLHAEVYTYIQNNKLYQDLDK